MAEKETDPKGADAGATAPVDSTAGSNARPAPNTQPDLLNALAARLGVQMPVGPQAGLDETQEGGRYIVNDQLVDANGAPVKERK